MSVRFAILGLLAQKPRHGYELRAAFEAVVGGEAAWEVKPAQIYATLDRLAASGLVDAARVTQAGGPEKQIFELTHAGQAALLEWFQTSVPREHQRDEFFVKLMIALLTGYAHPQRVIQVQRSYLYRELHNATALRESYNPRTSLAQILLLDKAIMHLEADLRWLDITETRLEEIRRQPLPEPEAKPRGRPKKES